MKQTIFFFIRHYIFWFLIFVVFRIFFLASLLPLNDGITLVEIFQSLVIGFRLDISTASYFAVLPFLLTILLTVANDQFIFRIINLAYRLLILIVIVLSLSNIIIYKHWGTLLNSRGLTFATQPTEMLASVTSWELFLITVIIVFLFMAGNYFYKKFLFPAFTAINGTTTQRIIGIVIVLPIIIIGFRGGLQLIPVNESAATFTNHRVLNQVAINNIWYLGHNVYQARKTATNNYQWMDDSKAEKIVKTLVNTKPDEHHYFSSYEGNPNVIFILLESWTSDIIEPLNGVKGVSPTFTQLCQEGLLFSSVYSSGFRTDQALVSVLSGFPAQPNKSIIRFPDKTIHLPSVFRQLKNKGYSTSFYYGGDIEFANMNNYLNATGVDNTISIDDFDSNERNNKWGAHDEFVLRRHASDMQQEKEPFFSTLLTLSTHEPFEVPVATPFTGTSEPELFKKSAWYTDYCLAKYFEQVRKSSWFNNTIFILMADHGHRLPMNRKFIDPDIRKIPLLIWSPLLKPELRGTVNGTIGNQHDLAATLLAELNIPHDQFEWSNDLLNPDRKNFAYLSLDVAITWLNENKSQMIPLEEGKVQSGSGNSGQDTARAYLQHLYARFLAY